ncbi:SDR family NAD(P)-dependent oxidoreductase [Winogradskya humida]|uniref:Short-chain dehydrogenase n=1 Tax=Winogradskya humida TaxID=113566 RepID=A0ABQ3ZZM6_9ACTN|nr:SDR family NAD(P)-dependent oxidoreductase [Actinoplanes humidus]GIE24075.1 short-chain dehydrogenase [Actinoplanes humidus]
MSTRTAVVTGGTAGIGLHTAIGLAEAGFAVTVVGRDKVRGAAALERLNAAGSAATFIAADLSSQDEVRGLAGTLRERGGIDVLVNNVGGLYPRRRVTGDGFEATFFLTHLSGYLLTELLLEDMVAAGRGRIVNTVSQGIVFADRTPFGQADVAGPYYAMAVYGRAMVASLAWTHGLVARLAGTGVTVVAAAPPGTRSDMGKSMRASMFPWPTRLVWPVIWFNVHRTPVARAARMTLTAATDKDIAHGTVLGIDADLGGADNPETVAAVERLSRDLAPVRG